MHFGDPCIHCGTPHDDVAPGPCPSAPAETYRGWAVHQNRWPEPPWSAISPDYDASYEGEEDGWVSNGEYAIDKGDIESPGSAGFILWTSAPDNVYADPHPLLDDERAQFASYQAGFEGASS